LQEVEHKKAQHCYRQPTDQQMEESNGD